MTQNETENADGAQKFNHPHGLDIREADHEVLEIDEEPEIVDEGSETDERERYYGKMRIEHPRVEPILVVRQWDVDADENEVHEYTRYYEADKPGDGHHDVIHDARTAWSFKDEPNFEANLTVDPQAELGSLLENVGKHTYDRLTKTIGERVDDIPKGSFVDFAGSVPHTRNDTPDLDASDRFETAAYWNPEGLAGHQIWIDREKGGYVADLRDHGKLVRASDSLMLAHELAFWFEEPIITSSQDEKTTGVTPSGLVVYKGGEIDDDWGGEHLLDDFNGEGFEIAFYTGDVRRVEDVRDKMDMEEGSA